MKKDLEKRLQDKREKRNKRLRDKYNFARDCGFSSDEAQLLMHKSKENIIALAKQRQDSETNG